MAQRVLEAIEQAGTNFVESVAQFLPRAVVTLSIIVVGWFIAIMLKWLTRWVLGRVGFDRLCERFELAALLKTAGLPSAEALASAAVFWIVWIGFLLSGVDVLGFTVLQGLVDGFALFVPRLVVALVILVAGYVFANIAWRATVLAAVNARLPSPRVLAGAVACSGAHPGGGHGARPDRRRADDRTHGVCDCLRCRHAGPGDRLWRGGGGNRPPDPGSLVPRTRLSGT